MLGLMTLLFSPASPFHHTYPDEHERSYAGKAIEYALTCGQALAATSGPVLKVRKFHLPGASKFETSSSAGVIT